MCRRRQPPSQGWKTFLRNHAAGIASVDLFVVRTISFKLLYGLVILRHARRRLVSISVTNNPTAERIARQVTDAFPWDEAPRHLISRPRRSVRSSIHPPHSCNGDPRSPYSATLAVAKRPRRTPNQIDTSRIHRPLHCVRRSAFAPHPQDLRFVLQRGPDSSFIGQECAGLPPRSAGRRHRGNSDPFWTREIRDARKSRPA